MGILGAGIGLGSWSARARRSRLGWDLTGLFEGAADAGVNPFSGAAALALGLALVNLAWAAARFPETRAQGPARARRARAQPFSALARLDFPGVKALNVAYFVYFVAFGAMEFTLVFLAKEHLGYGSRRTR